jgi:hypothetical protein
VIGCSDNALTSSFVPSGDGELHFGTPSHAHAPNEYNEARTYSYDE